MFKFDRESNSTCIFRIDISSMKTYKPFIDNYFIPQKPKTEKKETVYPNAVSDRTAQI